MRQFSADTVDWPRSKTAAGIARRPPHHRTVTPTPCTGAAGPCSLPVATRPSDRPGVPSRGWAASRVQSAPVVQSGLAAARAAAGSSAASRETGRNRAGRHRRSFSPPTRGEAIVGSPAISASQEYHRRHRQAALESRMTARRAGAMSGVSFCTPPPSTRTCMTCGIAA